MKSKNEDYTELRMLESISTGENGICP